MEIVVEDYVAYEDNVRWRVHDAYFEQSGLTPWANKLIPQETTNGPTTALQHARMFVSASEQFPTGDLNILEIGAGAGGFVVNLIDALAHQCGEPGRQLVERLHYYLSDYQPATLAQLAESDRLRPLIEAGVVSMAHLDVRKPFELNDLEGNSIDVRFFAVVANYIACATPVRWIQKNGDVLSRCFIQTRADIETDGVLSGEQLVESLLREATTEGILDQLSYVVDWRPESAATLGGGELGGRIVERTLAHVPEGTVAYPFDFIRILGSVMERLAPGGIVHINDLGRCDKWELRGLNMPVFQHYGNTLNHPIHTAIYEAFAYELGFGFIGSTDPLAPLQQVMIVNGPQIPDPLRRSFIDHVQLRSDLTDFLDYAEAAQISNIRGEGDRAIRLLRRCIRFEPRSARMRYQLSELCAQHGYPRLAQDYIRQGLTMPDAGQYDFDFLLGRVYADLGDRDEAIAAFQRSIERGPHEVTYSNLGELWSEMGDLDQAYQCWRRALELDPGHERAASRLEWLKNKMWSDRCADLDQRFGLDPTAPESDDSAPSAVE